MRGKLVWLVASLVTLLFAGCGKKPLDIQFSLPPTWEESWSVRSYLTQAMIPTIENMTIIKTYTRKGSNFAPILQVKRLEIPPFVNAKTVFEQIKQEVEKQASKFPFPISFTGQEELTLPGGIRAVMGNWQANAQGITIYKRVVVIAGGGQALIIDTAAAGSNDDQVIMDAIRNAQVVTQ